MEGEAGYTTLERTGVRPSLDVNGIWGGYIEEGTKTVIPSKASAKISMRLVPNQDYRKIGKLFEKYFKSIAPKSVKVTVKSLHGGMPYVAPTDMPAYKAAEKAVAETFGKKPLPFYSGGSIPIISGFESILGIKSLLIGFGLAEDAIHSPNESYGLEQFYKGVETIPLFYKYFADRSSDSHVSRNCSNLHRAAGREAPERSSSPLPGRRFRRRGQNPKSMTCYAR